jgi:molybdopterin synthase catalytic subunit
VGVRVQTAPFDVSAELALLQAGDRSVGAIAAFVGTVREQTAADGLSLTLEHYPGMTEDALEEIVAEAKRRFAFIDCLIVHRVGDLLPTDAIVLVAVTSAHRKVAFDACAFVMDFLKTRAPFWKKETTRDGSRWVEARASDDEAANDWDRRHG